MKVSKLGGALLDYWVARADGFLGGTVSEAVDAFNGEREPCVFTTSNGTLRVAKEESVVDWSPSTDWAQTGPIIERARIDLSAPPNMDAPDEYVDWAASVDDPKVAYTAQYFGETPLIAAMRAYVASKFGDEVPDVEAHDENLGQ
ncbi:phage protein NinX family protein [Burkholderia stabilis]